MIVNEGTARQTRAAFRQVVTVPITYTIRKPTIAATIEQANRTPRIEGWLLGKLNLVMVVKNQTYQISPTYVRIGASIRPVPNPINTTAAYSSKCDWAKYNRAQAIICGILTKIIDLLRPKGSVTHPERALPIGWPTKPRLPNDCIIQINFSNTLAHTMSVTYHTRWPVRP